MKKLLVGFVLSSALALAGSWTGTLVDVNCKGRDLSSHTRECALSCAKSGFGLAMPDGKFVKFDERGNAKALAALKATGKENDLKVTVTGTLKADVMQVDAINFE